MSRRFFSSAAPSAIEAKLTDLQLFNKIIKDNRGILTIGAGLLEVVVTVSQLYLTSELKSIDSKIAVMDSKFDAKLTVIESKFSAIDATLNLIMKQLNERGSMQEMNKRMLQLEIDKAVREQLQKKE